MHKFSILSGPTFGFGLLLMVTNAESLQPAGEVAISLKVPVSVVLKALFTAVLPKVQTKFKPIVVK